MLHLQQCPLTLSEVRFPNMTTGRLPSIEGGIQPTIVDAKGDLIAATAADTPAVLTVGANGTTLIADSSEATGLAWKVDPVADLVTTAGDTLYATAADTLARLGIGTVGQVLQVNSGATAPEWATPASGGGMTLISETVASGLSSLSLSSIPGTYKQLLLVWHGITHSGTGSRFVIRFNNSSGAYGGSAISALGATTIGRGYNHNAVELDGGTNSAPFGVSANFSASDQNAHANGQLLLDDYASTTKYKGFYTTWGYYNNSAAVYTSAKVDAYFLDTSAITSVDIVRIGGSATFSNATNTTIRLYGVS